MKRYLLFSAFSFIALFTFFPFVNVAGAEKEPVDVYLFYSETCPHCHEEREFFEEYTKESSDKLVYHEYEIRSNQELFSNVAEALDEYSMYVPYLVIGDDVLVGFSSADTTGEQIREMVDNCYDSQCYDPVECEVLNPGTCAPREDNEGGSVISDGDSCIDDCELPSEEVDSVWVKVPFIDKQIDIAKLSLPVMSVFLGVVDGFNPCAMWILIFLISLLIKVENPWKRWTLGAIFIFFSALVYFAALAGWGFVFSFTQNIEFINIIVGMIAFASGANFLYKYYKNEIKCDAVDSEQKNRIMRYIDNVVNGKYFWRSVILLSVVAIGVNLIELYCSIGLPMIFADVLEQSGVSTGSRYFYMLLYILFYMIDDLIIFTLSMLTLQVTGIGTKYLRYVNLIGGIILVFISFALLFKPELLTFGG